MRSVTLKRRGMPWGIVCDEHMRLVGLSAENPWRIDTKDKKSKTKQEFMKQYGEEGGVDRWNQSRPVSTQKTPPAMKRCDPAGELMRRLGVCEIISVNGEQVKNICDMQKLLDRGVGHEETKKNVKTPNWHKDAVVPDKDEHKKDKNNGEGYVRYTTINEKKTVYDCDKLGYAFEARITLRPCAVFRTMNPEII